MIPKLGAINIADLELPEIGLMSEEPFRMEDYNMERDDLGYLSPETTSNPSSNDPGRAGVTQSTQFDARQDRAQNPRTGGERTQSQTMDESDSGARGEVSKTQGGPASVNAEASHSSANEKLNQFQGLIKKLSQGKNIGKVDKDANAIKSVKKSIGAKATTGKNIGGDSTPTEGAESAVKAGRQQSRISGPMKSNTAARVQSLGATAGNQSNQSFQDIAKVDTPNMNFAQEAKAQGKAAVAEAGQKTMSQLVNRGELRELLQSLRSGEKNEAVLRVTDTEAGNLEIHVRMDGADLAVQVRAEDMGLRDKMLTRLQELQDALKEENIVNGEVNVSERDAQSSSNGNHNPQHASAEGRSNPSHGGGMGRSANEQQAPTTNHSGQVYVVA